MAAAVTIGCTMTAPYMVALHYAAPYMAALLY
jgi:hypothetical protein